MRVGGILWGGGQPAGLAAAKKETLYQEMVLERRFMLSWKRDEGEGEDGRSTSPTASLNLLAFPPAA
jgi:hypothetical protein